MGHEIERKFLLASDEWRGLASGTRYRQGYLSTAKDRSVRVRTIADKAYLTIKGATIGATRREFEYEIPLADGQAMLDELCLKPLIEKDRFKISHAGLIWEVDVFLGDNAGLAVAEVELEDEDQPLTKPDWVGREVTDDPRYYNANLIENPFRSWPENAG